MINKQLILFDGVCNFCNGAVNFIIKRDPEFTFVFASIQSPLGQAMIVKYGLESKPDTFALISQGQCHTMSDGVLKVARQMSGLWLVTQIFWVVPKKLRDFIYIVFGRNRYKWFGKRDHCVVPSSKDQSRFVGDQDYV